MRILFLAAGIYGDLLLGMTREIPAGRVSEMREQGVDAGLVYGLFGAVFRASVF